MTDSGHYVATKDENNDKTDSKAGCEAGSVSNDKQVLTTKVVKIQRKAGKVVQGCDIYIGRECKLGGWMLEESVWHNPYKLSDCKDSTECLQKYLEYISNRPDLLIRLHELKGKTLGCWCKPKPCHGDVLVWLIQELDIKDTK